MGNYTREDREAIHRCIGKLHDLAAGRRPPKTMAQERFIEVAKGHVLPSSKEEFAYIRWMADNKPFSLAVRKYFSMVIGQEEPHQHKKTSSKGDATALYNSYFKKNSSFEPSKQSDIRALVQSEKCRKQRQEDRLSSETPFRKENFKKRKEKDPWGSREAWRRDSRMNKFNGR